MIEEEPPLQTDDKHNNICIPHYHRLPRRCDIHKKARRVDRDTYARMGDLAFFLCFSSCRWSNFVPLVSVADSPDGQEGKN